MLFSCFSHALLMLCSCFTHAFTADSLLLFLVLYWSIKKKYLWIFPRKCYPEEALDTGRIRVLD
jgi:hypothetical protein